MRVAAIDIGTNSVLLLVAEQTARGPQPLLERAVITRLGRGVDESGRLSREGWSRTLDTLGQYAGQAHQAGAERVAAVGTSALRDAADGAEFLTEAERVLGVAPRVIDGLEEAQLTFSGGLSGIDVTGSVVVFDVGGGSTEIISGVVGGSEPAQSVSLNVGSVRLFERYLHDDPPTSAELVLLREEIHAALGQAHRAADRSTLVGVAGTVTTLAAVQQQLQHYDSSRVHGARLGEDQVARLAERLSGLTVSARRELAGIEPARADVIVAGVWIVYQVMSWAGAGEIIVSDRGVRWGLVHQMLA